MIAVPGECRGTEETAAKSRALLVRPIDQADGDRRLAVVLFRDAAQHRERGHHAESTVQPAAIGNRVEVAADDQRLF